MSFSVEELARIAIDLQSDIGPRRPLFAPDYHPAADPAAMPRRCCYEAHQFVPLAIDGLAQDVLGAALRWKGIRGWAIARAGDVVRFPADSDCPTPMTG
jgi:anaerobic nitric oxide reductase transcription regulator